MFDRLNLVFHHEGNTASIYSNSFRGHALLSAFDGQYKPPRSLMNTILKVCFKFDHSTHSLANVSTISRGTYTDAHPGMPECLPKMFA
jgi:hypothetical protein